MDARQFGPYRLKALIGIGGMGEVFHAYDTQRQRSVAVKLLPEKFSNDRAYQRRFRRESYLAARLREPHIIPIHDFGEIEGRLFIDMRLVDGESIYTILETHGPMTPTRAVHLVGQVAEALEVAHADGLVHRDIKPSNVLVTENDFVYVIDFGIAHTIHTDSTALTKSGMTVGTLDYMAPERFKNRHIDSRVDVYSLACLLYECLTAHHPFPGHDLPSLMYAHVFTPPPQPSKINPEVPATFDAVIAKGMAKEPDDRFDTVVELADAARAALATAPSHGAAEHSSADGPVDDVEKVPPTPDDSALSPVNRSADPKQAEPALETSPWDFLKDSADRSSVIRQATPTDASTRTNSTHMADPPGHTPTLPSTSNTPNMQGTQSMPEKKITINAGAPPPPLSETQSKRTDPASTRRRRKKAVIAGGAIAVIAALVLLFFILDRRDNRGLPLASNASLAVPAAGERIPVGAEPGFIAVTPDGRYAYTANREDRSLSVIDTTQNAVTATVPVAAGEPQFIAFTPNGDRAYLSINDPERNTKFVGVLDAASNTILGTANIGVSPFALAVSPDGKHVYVAEHDSGIISVLDTATNKVITTIRVPPNPHSIKFSQDGSRAYIASHDSNEISVLDTVSNTVIATVPVGAGPHSLAIAPDQTKVAEVNYEGNTVSVIDTATNKVSATIPVGIHPHDIAFAPDGQHAYVANKDSDTVSVISLRTNQVTATVPAGKGPTRVAVLPNGQHAYVTNVDSGDVTVLNTTAQRR